MVCSPEQLASNRRNAKLSTGPKTPEGKARSRRNGLKHGMTGAGVVVADEDVEAVRERIEAFETDLKPANHIARFLTTRVALLSVRLERSAREEAARIDREMLLADDVEEDQRAEEFEILTASVFGRPVESVRKLRRSEEGIDWLLEQWRTVRRHLHEEGSPRWSIQAAEPLTGRRLGSLQRERLAALDWAVKGHFDLLAESDWPDLSPEGRKVAARAELAGFIDLEIAELEEAREGLDRDRIARVRSGTAARALFPATREAVLARKYEAATAREFYRALGQIEQINEQAAEVGVEGVDEATPDFEETCGELGSSFPATDPGAVRSEVIEALGRQDAEGADRRGERPGVIAGRGGIGPVPTRCHPGTPPPEVL